MSKCNAAQHTAPPADNIVTFEYRNHRGEVRTVRINALAAHMWTGSTRHYPDEQPLLTAWDMDRQDERTYAMRNVLSWGEV
jgi:hypothetical protein